jgi:hypothetical protein
VRIGLFQHALAHPEANGERFESIEAKLETSFAPIRMQTVNQSGDTPKRIGTESVFRPPM